MRYKVAPGPAEYDLLVAAAEALPLVPGDAEDCCARIRDRTPIPARDEAREWLTFLQALGLAVETDRGFHRVRNPPDREQLAGAFPEHVYGVRELLGALESADRGLSAAETFERVRDIVPRWERDRDPDWEDTWTTRVRSLLDWAVVFGHAEVAPEGYRRG